jgi:hypothetical protein
MSKGISKMNQPLSNLAMRDIETLIHPYTNLSAFRETGPTVIEEGKGIYVYDHEGKEYIEGLAGCGARRWAMATRKSSTLPQSRCSGCPIPTSLPASRTTSPSNWPRR